MDIKEKEVLIKVKNLMDAMGIPQEEVAKEMIKSIDLAKEKNEITEEEIKQVEKIFDFSYPRKSLEKPGLTDSDFEDIEQRYDSIKHYLSCINYELKKMPAYSKSVTLLCDRAENLEKAVEVARRNVLNITNWIRPETHG